MGVVAALVIAVDLLGGHRQHMWIMNVVWPVTALWAGPFALLGYFRYGRAGDEAAHAQAIAEHEEPPNLRQPFGVLVAKGTTHCGSGCTLGDIVAELVMWAAPLTLFGRRIFGSWVYSLVLAFLFGIAFQYFTIKPMRDLRPVEGLKAALEADALSLLAWQVGVYGWMALATFALFRRELGSSSPVFWFMMQLGMVCGFMTSYPVNRWLLRRGLKEKV